MTAINKDIAKKLSGLSPEDQRKLLKQLLLQQQKKQAPTSKKAALSFAQERLWFLYELDPNSPAYNLRTAVHLSGNLHVPTLQDSLNEIVSRHETLRTRIITEDDVPLQLIAPEGTLELEIEEVAQEDVDRLADEEAQRPFSLSKGPLIRAKLLRINASEHVLLVTMQHIISDGWSIGLFIRELTTLYEEKVKPSGKKLPDVTMQYAEFAEWQRGWLQGESLEKQVNYWKDKLGGELPILELPTDYPRPPQQDFAGARTPFISTVAVTDKLRALCQAEGVTLFMLLMATFKTLLFRYTHQEDLLVGTPIAGRSRRQLEGMIGLFINTLVMRTDASGNPTFREFLGRVKETATEAYSHQDMPFERLVEAVQPPRDASRSALFQVMLILQNAPMDKLQLADLSLTQLRPNKGTSQFDLTMTLWDEEAIRGYLEYSTALYKPETIDRVLAHFGQLLAAIAENPDSRLSDLPLLTSDEEAQILQTWNQTAVNFPSHTLPQLIEQTVARIPDAPALTFGDETLTYATLNARVNQLAHYLQAQGVISETWVGVCMDRSPEMVISLLAILKAGGAYIPIDPNYPADRVHYMLTDAHMQFVLTQTAHMALMPDSIQHVMAVDALPELANQPTHNLQISSKPEQLAYMIYTSGSTGKPKGVQIPHGALTNFLHAMQHNLQLHEADVLTAVTTISFDIAGLELYLPLVVGAQLHLISRAVASDGLALLRAIGQATIMQATPATWRLLLAADWAGSSDLTVLCGGEALPKDLAQKLLPLCKTLWNVYGPTETTIWSAMQQVTGPELPAQVVGDVVTVGRPIANTTIYILDSQQRPVPIGVQGDLYIGGHGLARGYFERPDLTNEKFIPNPFNPQERIYNTGDVAAYLPNGDIAFYGRSDHQVKVRGYRIELGEIEHQLMQYGAVQTAVVVTRPDPSGENQLVAYVTASSERTPTSADLTRFLAESLPTYMIPAIFMILDVFPLTPNGKINRRALPDPDMGALAVVERVPPRNDLEQKLATLWHEVLDLLEVGVFDNFFELGGQSLLATQLASRIRRTFEVEIPLVEFFELTTIARQAERIQQNDAQGATSLPAVTQMERPLNIPLSFTQKRLWILERLTPGLSNYHLPFVLRLKGKLAVPALQSALDQVVARHETLRTNILMGENGEPYQRIHPHRMITIEQLEALTPEQLPDLVRGQTERPFDFAQDPLLRVALVEVGHDEQLLILVMHHVISDGWSINVLIQELTALYHNKSVAPLAVQYADYTLWQQEWMQGERLEAQASYWKEKLAGIPPHLELPMDYSHPAVQTFNGKTIKQPLLDPTELEALRKISNQENVSLFMLTFAAFNVLLYRYSQQTDIAVGTPIANRGQSELEKLIGFFANTLVLRTELEPNQPFRDLLQQVKQTALGAFANQDMPFEKLVEIIKPQRDVSRSPLFQVVFTLQESALMDLHVPDLEITPVPLDADVSKFELTLNLLITEHGLQGLLEYNTDLFASERMARLLRHYKQLLQDILYDVSQSVSQLTLLDEAERQLLQSWNETAVATPDYQSLPDVITHYAQLRPHHPALIFGEQTMSYQQLEQASNQLAHYLIEQGVTPETIIGLCIERSLEMVVGILGIMKAGGTYVPLSPNNPPDRMAYLIADTQAPIILTHSTFENQFIARQTVALDKLDLSQYTTERPTITIFPEHLAYMIYTSGSTGQPKGTMIRHKGILNLVEAQRQVLNLSHEDRVLQFASYTFDASIMDMIIAWGNGSTLCLGTRFELLPGADLANFLKEKQINVAMIMPSALSAMPDRALPDLHTLCVGGEACSANLVNHWAEGRRMFNFYGPTESTIWCNFAPCEAGKETPPPIGAPGVNMQTYVLDQHLQFAPIGVVGELYVGGAGVTRGYWQQGKLTAKQYIPNPFGSESGSRLYKTGDLVRYRADGQIEFVGRADAQVKIRGYRIELGEIESVLGRHDGVKEAVVMVREDTPQNKRLVGYVIPHQGFGTTSAELNVYLRAQVPDYMVPDAIVLVASFPQTQNGKLDYDALPVPKIERMVEIAYEAPQTAVQEKIAIIMQDVLQMDKVGIHDNFFDLGAHSYLLVQAHARLQQEVSPEVAMVDLFRYTSIFALSKHLSQDEAQEQEQKSTVKAIKSREQKKRDAMRKQKNRRRSRR